MIVRMEVRTDTGREFGGSIPNVRTPQDLQAAIDQLSRAVQCEAMKELEPG